MWLPKIQKSEYPKNVAHTYTSKSETLPPRRENFPHAFHCGNLPTEKRPLHPQGRGGRPLNPKNENHALISLYIKK